VRLVKLIKDDATTIVELQASGGETFVVEFGKHLELANGCNEPGRSQRPRTRRERLTMMPEKENASQAMS
jgi:hypothetical protein